MQGSMVVSVQQRNDVRVKNFLVFQHFRPSFLIIMSVQTEQNDLFFALENAESGRELLEAIDAYVEGGSQEV